MRAQDETKRAAKPRGRSSTTNSGPFVDHNAAIEFLNSTINIERVRPDKVSSDVWKLDRMHALMRELGDPQDTLEIIHIAGSKGKGSTCNMLEGALQGCGYTTGVFTSPHLIDVRERVRIGGDPVSEFDFDDALASCRSAASAIEKEHGAATYFEILTALAFVVFAQQAVDIAIIETGLGGRLDCTNVVKPKIVAITQIQLEHTEVLGDTIEKIAAEKAGIIKRNCIALSVPQEDSVIEVFREHAAQQGAPLYVLGQDMIFTKRFQSGVQTGPSGLVCVGDDETGFEHITVPLIGMHQAPNCALALAVIAHLRQMGHDLPERGIVAGLAQIDQRGRLECVLERPRIYIDGAHTPDSVRSVIQAIAAHIDYDSLIVVFGCAADKDVEGMIEALGTGADKVIFTASDLNPRSIEPEKLHQLCRSTQALMSETSPSVKDAINAAAAVCDHGQDLILVTGSFYVVGEAKQLIESRPVRR